MPGVQEDCVAILRFDNEPNMNAWLASDERRRLIEESAPLVEEFHARMVQSGFEQWFRESATAGAPLSVWKMDMIVLLTLYPVVFLWSQYVAFPYLGQMSFAVSLFLGNIFSVGLTGFLVPWVANRMGWWLAPTGPRVIAAHLLGVGLMMAAYALIVLVFSRFY